MIRMEQGNNYWLDEENNVFHEINPPSATSE